MAVCIVIYVQLHAARQFPYLQKMSSLQIQVKSLKRKNALVIVVYFARHIYHLKIRTQNEFTGVLQRVFHHLSPHANILHDN